LKQNQLKCMRNLLGLAVLGLVIAGVNNSLMFPFSVSQSQSLAAGAVVDRTLVDRETGNLGSAAQTDMTGEIGNQEAASKATVSISSSLFWDFKNLSNFTVSKPPHDSRIFLGLSVNPHPKDFAANCQLSTVNCLTISYFQLLDLLTRRPDSNDRAREIVTQPGDLARFEKVIRYAKQQNLPDRPYGEIIEAIADNFLGTPYAEGLLDKSGEEKLTIALNSFDCVLFVETVLAISRGIAVKDYDYQNFVDRIESQRYVNGKMNGYCSRLHYFSEWINDNHKKQIVENITAELGGVPMDKKLNFMTQHRNSYPQMANESTYQCIVGMESNLAKVSVNYLPTNRIKSAYSQLKRGDIIAVATDIKGLDVTHTGFVYRTADGNIGLIHASPAGEVTVARDLHRYISRVESAIGIVVARPKRPITQPQG
jgi:Protein of unknown function (DUF1460)